MLELRYMIGDATQPVADYAAKQEECLLIVHCCNDTGLWGRGFVIALSQRFPQAERCYRESTTVA